MKNVVVVGGNGFVGVNLCLELAQHPNIRKIVIYDNLSSRGKAILPSGIKGELVTSSIEDTSALERAMEGADTVFHLAANPDISKAEKHPDTDFWNGTVLTQHVLEAMRTSGVGTIVFPSGSGVYGDWGTVAVREDMLMAPVSPYGASKVSSEALISAYCNMFGMRGVVLRFANLVGPYLTHGVIVSFIEKLRKNPSKLQILGDGKQNKSYVHVGDAISAMLLLLEEHKSGFGVWNCATQDCVTVDHIADAVIAAMHLDKKLVEIEYTGGYGGWKGDVPAIRFDSSKLRRLGWESRFSSSEAVWSAIQATI